MWAVNIKMTKSVFLIAFFPFILLISIFFSDYLYNPFLRIGIIAIMAFVYIQYSLKRKYKKNSNNYFEKLSLKNNRNENGEYFYETSFDKRTKTVSIKTYINGIYGYDFYLKPEMKFEKFIKSFGFGTECQTLESKFDKHIYIVSDKDEVCLALKENPTLRQTLFDIFSHKNEHNFGVRKIECFDGTITVISELKAKEPNEPASEQYANEVAPMLQDVAKFFPSKDNADDKLFRETSNKITLILQAIMISLLINGGIMAYAIEKNRKVFPYLLNSTEIFVSAIFISSILFAIFAFIAFYLLRSSSRLSPVLLQLSTIGLLGIFITSATEIWELNIRLDDSKADILQAVVYNRTLTTHRRSPTTYKLDASISGKQPMSFDVPQNIYNLAEPRDVINVEIKNGFFGYKWIDNITVKKSEENIFKAELQKAVEKQKQDIKNGKYWDDMVAEANASNAIR
jgi:hypothetical protein